MTWGDVRAAARTNSQLSMLVYQVDHGFLTENEALIRGILWFCEAYEALMNEKRENWKHQPTSIELMLRPAPGPGKRWVVDSLSPFEAHVEDV